MIDVYVRTISRIFTTWNPTPTTFYYSVFMCLSAQLILLNKIFKLYYILNMDAHANNLLIVSRPAIVKPAHF